MVTSEQVETALGLLKSDRDGLVRTIAMAIRDGQESVAYMRSLAEVQSCITAFEAVLEEVRAA